MQTLIAGQRKPQDSVLATTVMDARYLGYTCPKGILYFPAATTVNHCRIV
jgi:hypothetical protein